jgi:signal transduction histidine kinase
MSQGISLSKKFLLSGAAYTLILIFSLLGFHLVSGRNNIRQHARREVNALLHYLSEQYVSELSGVDSELQGLQSRIEIGLLLNPSPEAEDAVLNPMKNFPQKYADVTFGHPSFQSSFLVRPVTEFGEMDAVVERHPALLQSSSRDAFQVSGPEIGAFGPVLRITRLNEGSAITARLHLQAMLDQITNRAMLSEDVRVLFTDSSQLIVHSSDPLLLNQPVRNTLSASMTKILKNASHRPLFGNDADCVCAVMRLAQSDLYLLVERDMSAEFADWQHSLLRMAAFSSLIFAVAFLLIMGLVRRFSRSLRDITRVAVDVADGDFSRKLTVSRNDELGVLFQAFNEMTDKLKSSYENLRQMNRELETKIHELTETRRELTQKQRLALVGEAISKISHEIQNKIGGVSLWVQNLERSVDVRSPAQISLVELKKAMRSFMDMLVNFKRFYRAPHLNITSIPSQDFLEQCVSRVRPDLDSKQIRCILNVTYSRTLQIDQNQMTDAIVNLLLNAIYYTPEHGEIQIRSSRTGNEYYLSITDQGPGIPPSAIHELFQPFYTTKASGSGLGLAIAQNIVQAHGGRITVNNPRQGGVCFSIMLPLESS